MKVLITSNRKYNSHKVKIVGTNLEITRCPENNKSLGSIRSLLDSSQLPVTSTVKTKKKIKEMHEMLALYNQR